MPQKLQYTELDPTRLDHPDDTTIQTTFPAQWRDIEQHTAAERQDSWCDAVVDAATKREIFSQPAFFDLSSLLSEHRHGRQRPLKILHSWSLALATRIASDFAIENLRPCSSLAL